MVITGATGCYTGVTGRVDGGDTGTAFTHTAQCDNPNVDPVCTPNLFVDPWFERGEDERVDYDNNGFASAGDLAIFDYNSVVPGRSGPLGSVSGRCFYLENAADPGETSYCTIVFIFDEGGLVVEGFYNDMVIVGASGCFAGLIGKVEGRVINGDTFEYVWALD